MTKLVVLSTPLHYDRFLQEGFDLNEFEIWCDDARYYDFLESKKISFRKLDEDLIQEYWAEINTWSCEMASKWILFCRNHNIFPEMDWATITCIFHGYSLAPILKSYRLSKLLIQQGEYDYVILFSGHDRKIYPKFIGNSYLNYFLEHQCKTLGISTFTIDLKQRREDKDWKPETRNYFRRMILPHLKKKANKLYALFAKPKKSFNVLAYGRLQNLSPVIIDLKKRGLEVALYDFEFHTEQFLFSLKQRISYLVPECFPDRACIDISNYSQQISVQFDQAFSLAANSDLFVYDGVDFKKFVQTRLFASMREYFLSSVKKINHYKNISSVTQIKSILTDDDFSINGAVFTGYFVSNQVQSFCVSHANFAVNVKVPRENCHFSHSYTVVNSEFEKNNYIRRGWEPKYFAVLGTPRYDRLVSMRKQRTENTDNRKCRILFCGTGLWPYSSDVYSYVGHQKECFGDVQIPALQAVFSIMKDTPIDLVIKPHSLEMTPYWKKLIGQSSVKEQIILKKATDDIFKLIWECDALILAYWSTTIIESAMIQKPTIYIDFRKIKSPILYEYSSQGFCCVVNSEESLRDAVLKICNGEHSFFIKPVAKETKRYYLGEGDGKATERVSDFINAKQNDFHFSAPEQSFHVHGLACP